MASGWHKLARVFQADWREIRTRGGQEVHKRTDLARYRLGRTPRAIHVPLETGTTAKFFFDSPEAHERARLLQQHVPDQAEAILREAENICRHDFRLLGYESLDYGTNIDWHLDRVHGKRAPLDPWYKIPFLDFNAVGDHKITWELNRHQHLVTLAKASLLTGDNKYVHEIIAQWHSWTEANPYPLGINWGSTLEVAFRSLSWIWVDHLLADEPQYVQFRPKLLPALAFHGRYIERYLSTYFSPNTHLLGEALALLFIGTLYPQMPRAQRWRDEGWKILVDQAGRQVRPDGVYFEQSLYYHVYALDFYLHARLLANRNGIAVSPAFDEVARKMLNVVEALSQAGPAEGFGDDDGGRLFNPRRNQTEHMTDPLALGAVLYNRDLSAQQLTEESIWLFGERAVARKGTDGALRLPRELASTHFPDGGLYVLAASEPFPHTMVIDAGPFGTGRCGHGHADALSLRLTMNGSRWLVDSGSGVYISADPAERNAFRGTVAHNTMLVDGLDQAIPDEPFSWTGIPTTRVDDWVVGRTFTYFAGSHDGYERLSNPVTHRRCVLRIDEGGESMWLVRDLMLGMMLGRGNHDLEINWHFASDLVLRSVGRFEFLALRPDAPNIALRLILPAQSGWHGRISQCRISPAYGRSEEVPVLRVPTQIGYPAEFATVLVAESCAVKTESQSRDAVMVGAHEDAGQFYELHAGSEISVFFFAHDKRPWRLGLFSSDAEVFYFRFREEKFEHIVAIGGSSLAWQGEPLLNASRPFQFYEWRRRDEVSNSEHEKFSTTGTFKDLVSALHSYSSLWRPETAHAEKH